MWQTKAVKTKKGRAVQVLPALLSVSYDAYRYVTALAAILLIIFINYRLGLNIRQAEYAVKKYKSHRRVNRTILMDVNIINNATN
jgi:hypothetical protein